ncbi:TetR/AcrR family transcriptional regulator [Dictyobacter aurantiacus]|uniref:TetR family transcriptional regulator n=1 Tax=Dictyobacter aurantiacus TaxID=1936993 RepID=A0A401ZDV9_9CHLR|nr:TetR/AcrR family transcriptional regulator [Dictyobacter aurantiacus]GCE05026.1 TetR family transcriptional regulator [Dictyobacter aurantiacus]
MSRGAKRAATREESEETRQTILRTAEQLFMEYGYRAVSTRQIADACGLTQPALYHYFADKQTLYVEVIKENTGKTQSAMERIVRRNEGIAERLRLIVRYLYNTTQHDISQMLHDIQHELDPQMRELLNQLFITGLIAPLASIFEEGIQTGFLRHPSMGGLDATNAAYLFMSMLPRFLSRPPLTVPEHGPSHASRHGLKIEQAEMLVQVLLYGLAEQGVGERHQVETVDSDHTL